MTTQISKPELLGLLRACVVSDPSFIAEVVTVMVSGAQEAVEQANRHAADMETLFVMSALHGKLPKSPRNREYLAAILERWAHLSRFNFAATIKELRATK